MLKDDQYEKARQTAYKYLSSRARTGRQVTEMLFKKGFGSETVTLVMGNLLEYGLLNDEAFAEQYVQKKSLRPRSVMAHDLKQLGVDEYVVDRVLAGIDSGAEMRVAMSLAMGMKKRRGNDYPLVKIAAFLSRRGFSQDIVERVCSCLENMHQP
ncbi:MAG: hypothetical protein JL50_11880 [Peptococcaceae bacterium BICA1-7]|nr:MAG: hypothetical protein JL50_11880 [Peptococcaceae bacterium BICA1-7]